MQHTADATSSYTWVGFLESEISYCGVSNNFINAFNKENFTAKVSNDFGQCLLLMAMMNSKTLLRTKTEFFFWYSKIYNESAGAVVVDANFARRIGLLKHYFISSKFNSLFDALLHFINDKA